MMSFDAVQEYKNACAEGGFQQAGHSTSGSNKCEPHASMQNISVAQRLQFFFKFNIFTARFCCIFKFYTSAESHIQQSGNKGNGEHLLLIQRLDEQEQGGEMGRGGRGVSQRMTNDDEVEEGILFKSDSVCGICLQNSAEKCINYADKILRQRCEIIKITKFSWTTTCHGVSMH